MRENKTHRIPIALFLVVGARINEQVRRLKSLLRALHTGMPPPPPPPRPIESHKSRDLNTVFKPPTHSLLHYPACVRSPEIFSQDPRFVRNEHEAQPRGEVRRTYNNNCLDRLIEDLACFILFFFFFF